MKVLAVGKVINGKVVIVKCLKGENYKNERMGKERSRNSM